MITKLFVGKNIELGDKKVLAEFSRQITGQDNLKEKLKELDSTLDALQLSLKETSSEVAKQAIGEKLIRLKNKRAKWVEKKEAAPALNEMITKLNEMGISVFPTSDNNNYIVGVTALETKPDDNNLQPGIVSVQFFDKHHNPSFFVDYIRAAHKKYRKVFGDNYYPEVMLIIQN